jgi:hypothetical protein
MDDLATQTDTPEVASWDDSIAAAWSDIQSRNEEPTEETQERAPDGKFAAKAETNENPATTDETVADTTETTDKPRAPSSWKKQAQADFEKLPAHIQEEVLRRENDFHKGSEGYKRDAERAKVYDGAIAPYMGMLQQMNVQPDVAIRSLLEAETQLRNGSPAEKTQMALTIIKDYGIDPNALFQALSGGNQQQADPAYAALMDKVMRMESQQVQSQRLQQAREIEALNSEIVSFSQGKEHFDAVKADMAALLETGRAKNLDDAYKKAIRLNDEAWQAEQSKQQAAKQAEAQKRAKEAKLSAKVNITSRGVIQPKAAVGSFDDTIRAEAQRLGLM